MEYYGNINVNGTSFHHSIKSNNKKELLKELRVSLYDYSSPNHSRGSLYIEDEDGHTVYEGRLNNSQLLYRVYNYKEKY